MAIDYQLIADAGGISKGVPRKRLKGRKDRAEAKVKKSVRAQCVERDGYCRLAGIGPVDCRGASEWAHLEDHKRARTRGMDPDERHQRKFSAMFCTGHHEAYDAGVITVEFLTRRFADGPMAFHWPEGTYVEPLPQQMESEP